MTNLTMATWNVNSLRVRLNQVLTWLQQNPVDILALQETKLANADFPEQAINEAGYKVIYHGQKTYNGVAILTSHPIEEVSVNIADLSEPDCRLIMAVINNIAVINVYVPNGQAVGTYKYDYKLKWYQKLTEFVTNCLLNYPNLVIMGDFNVAPAPEDVYDPKKWQGRILFSEPEREALQQLLFTGVNDCFRLFQQPEHSFSWWNYRTFAFRHNRGLRIDHILASQAMAQQCYQCFIDKEPRGWERPSDHAPMLACFKVSD